MTAAQTIQNADIIVIKIGSVLVADIAKGTARQSWIESLAADIQALQKAGKKPVIVSSGGIALGRRALGIPMDMPPSAIPLEQKQAASAVGQFHVFNSYYKAFNALDITVAQVLLTMSETENRRMHLNARATLSALLDKGIVPIINENDTVSTGEIRFGDNDRLAVRVAQMIAADLVILLSTTDGLYTDNPDKNPQAKHISVVEALTPEHTKMAGEAVPGLSTGGMKSKIEAAHAATRAGIPLIIAKGMENHPIKAIKTQGNTKTTLFLAQETTANARKKWIQAHLRPKGSVFIDNGALKALKNGKSLLPVGVVSVEGTFERGDAVRIKAEGGAVVAIGLAAYSASDAQKIIGLQSEQIQEILGYRGRAEFVHRNDMALQD